MGKSRILVTGGAGYIGSVCAQLLLERGHGVVIVDDLSTGHFDAVPRGAEFFEMSVQDRFALKSILAKCEIDCVFHFAAKALIPESIVNPGVFFDENVASTIALVESMREVGIRRLVFSSTAAVYGNPRIIPMPEQHPLEPVNTYGESKRMAEIILERYAQAYKWGIVAFRYFNACGATATSGERHEPETHLIPLILEAMDGQREEFCIFGTDYDTPDGTCLRDFVHVLDIADAHIRALPLVQSPGLNIFNIGTGRSYSVKEVCGVAQSIIGRPLPIRIAERRPGDPAVLCADSTKLQKVLGWKAEHSDLQTIIRSAWQWFQSGSSVAHRPA